MTIMELAISRYKSLQSTNPKNRYRLRFWLFSYRQGALDALKEIETRIEMCRHASAQTAETILASVEMTIKELKGE